MHDQDPDLAHATAHRRLVPVGIRGVLSDDYMENRILAALPAADLQHLVPHLESVPLPLGWRVHCAGARERHLYFPISGIVARLHVLSDGASSMFSITGNDGVIGVSAFLGGGSNLSQAVVVSPGAALRLRADILGACLEGDSTLLQLLLRYAQALLAQTGQTAVCNRHHALEQRLCSWLLSCADRLPSNDLCMTQEHLAHMLGVRRESVTEAACRLQRSGVLQYRRGHIAVLNRAGLEAHACECHGVVTREYDRLLPDHAAHRADTHEAPQPAQRSGSVHVRARSH